jgi:PAT family beta-lactamase induction signal transducer AmpG
MSQSGAPATPAAATDRLLPWLWVPSLYLVEGIPNSLVENAAPVLLQDLGTDKSAIPRLVATAALPWVIKPLWSPLIELYKTRRFWIWSFQALLGLAFGVLALGVGMDAAPTFLLLAFASIALISSTHDIAADGFYYNLDATTQKNFIGIRNTTYRFGLILGQFILVGAAGVLVKRAHWDNAGAWAFLFALVALVLAALSIWHKKVLPFPPNDTPLTPAPESTGQTPLPASSAIPTPSSSLVPPPARSGLKHVLREFGDTWVAFFRLKDIGLLAAFLLLFRLPEVQAGRIASIFLKDTRIAGGFALDNESLALVNALPGLLALTAGGLLGGALVWRYKLRRVLWPLVIIMHTPNLAFLALAHWQPESPVWIGAGIAVEKFGYGLGYTVFALVMLRLCDGPRRVAHYSFATGLAYLGNAIPGFWIGPLAGQLGYTGFFGWVMLCALPGLVVTGLIARRLPDAVK